MKRILIEFYSKRTPENLISLLKERYDGILFFYFEQDGAPDPKAIRGIGKITEEILGIRPDFHAISSPTVEAVLDCFSSLIGKECSYDFDITGGNEIFIAAAGIFLSQNKQADLSLHRYDIRKGTLHFRYPPRETSEEPFPRALSVPQILSLNGTPALTAPRYHFRYGPLRKETLRLWEAVKRHPKEWNLFCSLPADPTEERSILTRKMIGAKESHRASYKIIAEDLKRAGMMKNEAKCERRGKICMTFDLSVEKEALFLYEKAGNLLETFCALAAEDAGVFHDIRVGVTADWNGIPEKQKRPDPRNEIDLILMNRNLPILASCKNTAPQNEYLYEIMTMAKHYGGFFATPMLLSSATASPTVRQRAKEMDVILIDGIRKKSLEELTALFRHHFD